MASETPLAGRTVLVTRPAAQSRELSELIRTAGGQPLAFPLQDIVPVEDNRVAAERLARGGDWDWLIFVSTNAVRCALPLPGWTGPGRRPRIAAVGGATEKALESAGIAVDLAPKPQSNSDALLAAPELADVTGRKFLIVRGEGGRERLAEGLAERGAEVAYAELYRRVAATPPAAVIDLWRQGQVHGLTVTSGEALEHLMELLQSSAAELAERTPVAVMSSRIGELARSVGWRCVAVAVETSDRGLLDALVSLIGRSEPASPGAAAPAGKCRTAFET